jgi:hypothetical protein
MFYFGPLICHIFLFVQTDKYYMLIYMFNYLPMHNLVNFEVKVVVRQ